MAAARTIGRVRSSARFSPARRGVVEGQRGRGHVPDQLGLGRQVVDQVALVGAQVVADDQADRHQQRRQRGGHHDGDELLADRGQADHAAPFIEGRMTRTRLASSGQNANIRIAPPLPGSA
jgi:hypothetical protein